MWTAKTLLITDQNLGQEAHDRLASFCTDLTWLTWIRPDEEARSALLARIGTERWELAISFYSDLILPPWSLERITLPLNIHPALPDIRGVGYDVIPLIEGHAAVGATLHHIEQRIDAGRIYQVLETPISREQTCSSLRQLNQRSSLQMLDFLCTAMRANTGTGELRKHLEQEAAAVDKRWATTYTCRRTVHTLLEEIRADSPEHPCLR